ncbi:MAG: hypothetical protein ABSG83_08765 [Roseiarcus sp.]|jgi:hypothetical protein
MTDPTIERPKTPTPGAARGRRLVPVALALALLTSGCDKCGDYFWMGGSKSCHDQSQLK